MTESSALLRQEITELHERISQLAARLQIDPGGSDRLDGLEDAVTQLGVRLERLEQQQRFLLKSLAALATALATGIPEP